MSHLSRLIPGSSEVLNLYLKFEQIIYRHFMKRYFYILSLGDEGFAQRRGENDVTSLRQHTSPFDKHSVIDIDDYITKNCN